MTYLPSQLYNSYLADSSSILNHHLKQGLQAHEVNAEIPVFFRADDIGVVSDNFIKLLRLFSSYRVPLCLAVVPSWLTQARLQEIDSRCDISSELWCWHQHGWRHQNHQQQGKKGEFGSDRSPSALSTDILKGRDRLRELLGPVFSPFFTPPLESLWRVRTQCLIQGWVQRGVC